MAPRKQDPATSEMLLLVLAVVFCAIIGAVVILVFRTVGVELL